MHINEYFHSFILFPGQGLIDLEPITGKLGTW